MRGCKPRADTRRAVLARSIQFSKNRGSRSPGTSPEVLSGERLPAKTSVRRRTLRIYDIVNRLSTRNGRQFTHLDRSKTRRNFPNVPCRGRDRAAFRPPGRYRFGPCTLRRQRPLVNPRTKAPGESDALKSPRPQIIKSSAAVIAGQSTPGIAFLLAGVRYFSNQAIRYSCCRSWCEGRRQPWYSSGIRTISVSAFRSNLSAR
jgi:hypothetical protein